MMIITIAIFIAQYKFNVFDTNDGNTTETSVYRFLYLDNLSYYRMGITIQYTKTDTQSLRDTICFSLFCFDSIFV